MIFVKRCVGLGAVVITAVLLLGFSYLISPFDTLAQQGPGDDADSQFAPQGVDTCLTCHNNPLITSILSTPHGDSSVAGSPFAHAACETCHGASPDHVSRFQPPAIVFEGSALFEASAATAQNQVCLNCHQSRETVHWTASAHEAADLTCVTCHTIHGDDQVTLTEALAVDQCLTCHLEQRSRLNRRSHHPVAEGLMTCADCHNPHGSSTTGMLIGTSLNDLCTTCHTEKRGPFLWEHQPVTEDCTTCHEPHGSTQDRMLSVRQPFLCQGCHSEAYHPSFLYSGDDTPPVGAGQSVVGSSCTNCHSTIHGSNHPSGSRLTR